MTDSKPFKFTPAEQSAVRKGTFRSLIDLVGGTTKLPKFGPQGTNRELRTSARKMRFSLRGTRVAAPESLVQRAKRIIRALTGSLYGLEQYFQEV